MPDRPAAQGAPRTTALLGPTNTGKTHRAVERMLEHGTGMLGFPLRLLAREVYDRVSARVGEEEVALVTGEEKRVPAAPRYWVCTVEAMPVSRAVEFVAIDEVQLVAHRERGHIFTDRLLHLRGTEETWWMGSDTATDLVRQLVPDVHVQRLPRLSQLSHRGHSSLGGLPRRSAVVVFSAQQVYETADVLRQRRGGAAVVLGALSPRARNAQVALYQAGEVDYLVATDAIGMGLNLDLDHVGLRGLTKFDGRETRELMLPEVAQIVGRAGRHVRDGTFGTVTPAEELSDGAIKALESHRFAPVRAAFYRNSNLDFGSAQALLASLDAPPVHECLRKAPESDDLATLRHLLRREEVSTRLDAQGALQLAWAIARIPNYEKQLPEHHALRLAELFVQLSDHGHLREDWVGQQLKQEDDASGDLHSLMARIAGVRLWSYVSQQADWLRAPEPWRERTRELEDRLSDALHECLVQRFVEERRVSKSRAPRQARSREFSARPFAGLLAGRAAPEEPAAADAAQQRWVHALVDASFDDFQFDTRGRVSFQGERVAQLLRGQSPLHPELRSRAPDWTDGGMRARIDRRMRAFVRDIPTRMLRPLSLPDARTASAPVRGLLYQLQQSLGALPARHAREQLDALHDGDRRVLQQLGIVLGARWVFSEAMLQPRMAAARRALASLEVTGLDDWPAGAAGLRCFEASRLSNDSLAALGFERAGELAVRCDAVEDLLTARRKQPELDAGGAAQTVGAPAEHGEALQRAFKRRKRRRRR